MRITPHRQYQLGQLRTASQTERLADLRNQISSGVRIHKPSDDPHAQRLILNSQATSSHFESQATAINDVRALLNEAHVQLRSVQQLAVKARDIGLNARTINNTTEANILAEEIDGILETLNHAANARYDGHYLFAGERTDTQPYSDVRHATEYQGDSEFGTTQLAGAGHIKTFYAGGSVFATGLGGTTAVRGTTGAAPGVGTASGHGVAQLVVTHSETLFASGSGVLQGASAAEDDLIGPAGAFQLQIEDTAGDGSAGFVSLNNGQRFAFTASDTDLKVIGPNDHVIHLNMSAINPGFNGEVDVTANATMSLDEGATNVPVLFEPNQTLVDTHGNVRHLNTQGITREGVDTVQLTGNTDLFETLRAFRDDLRNYDDFTAEQWDSNVTEFLRESNLMSDHLLDVIGEQSVDLQTLDRIEDRGQSLKFEADKRLAELQGTDFASAILNLTEEQNLAQYTYATLAGVFQVSVLDYL